MLTTIFGKFEGIVDDQMIVDPSDNGALDPMIDRRRVPSLSCHFFLLGRVFDVAPGIGSFDLEGLERTGLGSQTFRADDF